MLSTEEVKSVRSSLSKAVVNPFFTGKISPKKIISELAYSLRNLGGKPFVQECDQLFKIRNNEQEHNILSSFGGSTKEDMRDLIKANQIKYDQVFMLHKSLGELTEDEIRNLFPEDKIILNRELFHERLQGIDFRNMPPVTEKKIIEGLVKDSIGLLREEVILYFNLIKINRLSVIVEEKRHQRKSDDIKRFQRMADVFVSSFIPKVITIAELTEINEGTPIEKDLFRDSILDKIKSGKFNPIEYITMATIGQGNFISHIKSIVFDTAKKMSQPSKSIWNVFVFDILFKETSDEYLSKLKIAHSLRMLLDKRIGKVSKKGIIIINFIHTVSINLCKQISEVRNKYQKADEVTRKKIFRLYGDEERLSMLFHASIDLAQKNLDFHKGEMSEIADLMKRYDKKKRILTKSEFFS